ncbi:Adenosine kinase [Sergentomyia squamirostris]
MHFPGFEDDELPRHMVPSVPREEIPVPQFAVPDVSLLVDRAPPPPPRRKPTYQEWQKEMNVVVLEAKPPRPAEETIYRTPESSKQRINPPSGPLETPGLLSPSGPSVSRETDDSQVIVEKLENLLLSYSAKLAERDQEIAQLSRERKPSTVDKSEGISVKTRSVAVQCDLTAPSVPSTTHTASTQTDLMNFHQEMPENRRASDSCIPGFRNPALSDAWLSTEMSLATRQYMEKYNLLEEPRHSPQKPSPNRNVLEGLKGLKKFHQPVTLVAFGNPILDMSVTIDDKDQILQRHQLRENDQLEISPERLMAVKEDVETRCRKIIQLNPGGSSLNTCRILRTLGQENILFCGSVAEDANGSRLLSLIELSGVKFRIQRLKNTSTAVCLCLINGRNRCLIANIGAAFKIQLSWLQDEKLPRVEIFYIEGYFIPERFPICQWIVRRTAEDSAKLAINLSAKYIVRNHPEELKQLLDACDLAFGNFSEFSALATSLGVDSLEKWVDSLAGKDKVLVITDGDRAVRLVEIVGNSVKWTEVPVPKVSNVQDTTGAGDAFVAGFFNAMIGHNSPIECVRKGIYTSGQTLSQIGCHLPQK